MRSLSAGEAGVQGSEVSGQMSEAKEPEGSYRWSEEDQEPQVLVKSNPLAEQ